MKIKRTFKQLGERIYIKTENFFIRTSYSKMYANYSAQVDLHKELVGMGHGDTPENAIRGAIADTRKMKKELNKYLK